MTVFSEPYFLGLDASTQSLKASLLSLDLDVIAECAVNFDADLPHYGTRGGVLKGQGGEVWSPVGMLVEALDVLFGRIKERGWALGKVGGVACSGQQHASVYWSRSAPSLLASPDPARPLAPQLEAAFSRPTVPNWQDFSTTAECRLFEAALGGPEGVARLTGSRAHERFTGAQIMRFRRTQPGAYDQTGRISLVSSAMTSLMCLDGEVKGIDESDACGMNLWRMDTGERGWCEEVMRVIVGEDEAEGGGDRGVQELKKKLGEVETDGGRCVGKVGRWWQQRYGFGEAAVFPGTGDNPATFLSLTLKESEGLVSLGTSDVVLVSTSAYNPAPEYHAFFHPAQIGPPSPSSPAASRGPSAPPAEPLRYFNMLVYKNGSLAREHVRNLFFERSWDRFNAAVERLRPKDVASLPNKTAFWWLLPDIIPDGASGVAKYVSEVTATGDPALEPVLARQVEAFEDADDEALAMLSSQLLNYRSRSARILSRGPDEWVASTPGIPSVPRLNRVYATGGASANGTILALMADVFNAPVCANVEYKEGKWTGANWNACSVGVGYKARWGWERTKEGREGVGFDQVVSECRDRRSQTRRKQGAEWEAGKGEGEMQEEGIYVAAAPGEGARAWERRVEWWRAMEARALKEAVGGAQAGVAV